MTAKPRASEVMKLGSVSASISSAMLNGREEGAVASTFSGAGSGGRSESIVSVFASSKFCMVGALMNGVDRTDGGTARMETVTGRGGGLP